MKINSEKDVNPAYKEWRSSTGPEKEQLLRILIGRLEKFATAICWQRLPDHKDEFRPLVNGIVWRAIKKADKFKGDSKFSTWFYRIVTNECNRFLRSHKERQEISFEEEFPIEPFGDLGVEVQQLVQGLDDRDFALFKMVAQGENFETIAETLHIKVGAAKTRWSRLRGRLRDAAL